MASMSVHVVLLGERCELEVAGELDIASRDELVAIGRRALTDERVRLLVISLAAVSFIDAGGVGGLISLRNRCRDRGVRMVLRDLPRGVARVLALTGLQSHFSIGDVSPRDELRPADDRGPIDELGPTGDRGPTDEAGPSRRAGRPDDAAR